MWLVPAKKAAYVRRTDMKRPKNTTLPPYLEKR
jgi:hypothetical protein